MITMLKGLLLCREACSSLWPSGHSVKTQSSESEVHEATLAQNNQHQDDLEKTWLDYQALKLRAEESSQEAKVKEATLRQNIQL